MPTRLRGANGKTLARWQDLFELLNAHPKLWSSLRATELLAKKEGRPRGAGEWALVYLAFVNSAERELRPWHQRSEAEMWKVAGFAQQPSYHTTYENFVALEAHEAVFEKFAAVLIQIAVNASGGKVGHAVHVDGTEAETNSRLVHDCFGDELKTCGHQMIAPRRVSPATAREERHGLATDLPTDKELLGAGSEIAADERGLRVKVGSCWYLLSDDDAGIRAYTTGGKVRRFWAGYYNLKAIDHYTGGVLAVHVESASTQEHAAYPGLYARLRGNLGEHCPRAIVADRGFSVSSVFEAHTRDGIASVIPWRKHYSEPTRKDHLPKYDRHGIPHCKHCGMEAIFHRFQHDAGPSKEPRLWFRCSKPGGTECESVQSMWPDTLGSVRCL